MVRQTVFTAEENMEIDKVEDGLCQKRSVTQTDWGVIKSG